MFACMFPCLLACCVLTWLLRCRNEVDAGNAKSFWQMASATFRNAEFNPVIFTCPNVDDRHCIEMADLDPAYNGYPADAEKMESEFKSLRTRLQTCLINFRSSGMGDCPVFTSEEERMLFFYSHKAYSSAFRNYTQGVSILLLMYCMFVETGILDAACGDMPEGTSHNNRAIKLCSNPVPTLKASSKRKLESGTMADGFLSCCRAY